MNKTVFVLLALLIAGCGGAKSSPSVRSTQGDMEAQKAEFNAQMLRKDQQAREAGSRDSLPRIISLVPFPAIPERYQGMSIEVHGTETAEGRLKIEGSLEDLDPDTQLGLKEALLQWVFAPAKKDGVPLGLRISLPLQL